MNKPPERLTRWLTSLLKVLGLPAYWLIRRLGYRPTAPAARPPLPPPPAPPAEPALPPGWTRPREMAEAKPTLAPVLLAFGLAGSALGLLVTMWSIVASGAAAGGAGRRAVGLGQL